MEYLFRRYEHTHTKIVSKKMATMFPECFFYLVIHTQCILFIRLYVFYSIYTYNPPCTRRLLLTKYLSKSLLLFYFFFTSFTWMWTFENRKQKKGYRSQQVHQGWLTGQSILLDLALDGSTGKVRWRSVLLFHWLIKPDNPIKRVQATADRC